MGRPLASNSLGAHVKTWGRTWRTSSRGERIFADVRTDGPSWSEFWALYADGRWEPWTTELMDSLLDSGSVFVDVGAWIGPLTIYASLACDARVLALEPDPVAFDALRDTIDRNLLEGVVATSVALTETPGEYGLVAHEDAWGDSMTRLVRRRQRGPRVGGNTLAHILAAVDVSPSDVGLVKIDVEGYEEQLMPTLGPWLGSRKIPLQVACHDVRPTRRWFKGYSRVLTASGGPTRHGYTGDMVALPPGTRSVRMPGAHEASEK